MDARRAVVLACVASAGCGRFDFGPRAAGSDGAITSIDAGDVGDAGPGADACTLGAFGPVRELAEVDSALDEEGPWISDDALTLVFASNRIGTGSDYALYISQRASTADLFGAPELLPLSATIADQPFLTQDLDTVWFDNRDHGDVGDIYVATRANPAAAFGAPTKLAELSINPGQGNASLTADQLTIVFDSGTSGLGDALYAAQRPTTTDAFGTPAALDIVPASNLGCCAQVSGDGATIVLATDVFEPGGSEIALSTRGPTGFGSAVELDSGLDADGQVGDPTMTADGKTIVFAANRVGATGDDDLYMAQRACE